MHPIDYIVKHRTPPGRRHCQRVETPQGVWVYWSCKGRDDTSRVADLSLGGLFLETCLIRAVDAELKLDFLVQEGAISADAIVRHTKPGRGMGVKFTSIRGEDRMRLAELVKHLPAHSTFQPPIENPAAST